MMSSVIVFSCITANNQAIFKLINIKVCTFNGSTSTCNYGQVIGFISLLFGIYLIIISILNHKLNYLLLRLTSLAEIILNTLLSIMWLAAFIDLSVKWAQTNADFSKISLRWLVNNNQTAITFAFFAFLFQTILTFLSVATILEIFGNSIFQTSQFDFHSNDDQPVSVSSDNHTFQQHLTITQCYRKFKPAQREPHEIYGSHTGYPAPAEVTLPYDHKSSYQSIGDWCGPMRKYQRERERVKLRRTFQKLPIDSLLPFISKVEIINIIQWCINNYDSILTSILIGLMNILISRTYQRRGK